MKKTKISECKLKEGKTMMLAFPIRTSHTPCKTIGEARYLCEVLKITKGYAYVYLTSHTGGEKLDCRLQKISLKPSRFESVCALEEER